MSDTWLRSSLIVGHMEQCIKEDLSHTDACGLSVVEVYILKALYGKDGVRPSDLAKAVGRAATAFTPLLDRLEIAGFVRRSANLEDRRSVRIFLETKGKKLQGVINNAVANAEVRYGGE